MKITVIGANDRNRTDMPKAGHFKYPVYTNFTTLAQLAGLTGLEPATSDVTGQHSNQLSYNPKFWKRRLDSNQRPRRYERRKLTNCSTSHQTGEPFGSLLADIHRQKKFGSLDRTRTCDIWINSPPFYRLNYERIGAESRN